MYISPDYAYISTTTDWSHAKDYKPLAVSSISLIVHDRGKACPIHRNVDQVSPNIYLDEYAYIYIYLFFFLSPISGKYIMDFFPKPRKKNGKKSSRFGWKRRMAGRLDRSAHICLFAFNLVKEERSDSLLSISLLIFRNWVIVVVRYLIGQSFLPPAYEISSPGSYRFLCRILVVVGRR